MDEQEATTAYNLCPRLRGLHSSRCMCKMENDCVTGKLNQTSYTWLAKKRLFEFYTNQKFVDCTFRIDGEELRCHKLILASCSPVFEKMFYGDLHSDVVEICDVSYEDFKQVINYVYSDNMKFTSIQNAWDVYAVAHKYILEELMQKCLKYIVKNVGLRNLVLSYEYAEMYSLEDLMKDWLKDIANYFHGIMCIDYHMKPSTLTAVMDEIIPDCNNKFTIVTDIIFWAEKENQLRNVPINTDTIVDLLIKVKAHEFIQPSWIKEDLLYQYSAPVCQTILKLKENLVSKEKIINFFNKNTEPVIRVRKEYKMALRVDLVKNEEYTSNISVSRKIILFGIFVTTLMEPIGAPRNFLYEGSITIRIFRKQSELVKSTTVNDVFPYDSGTYVPLQELAVLEPDEPYSIRISYINCNSGFSEMMGVHTYYMSTQLTDTKSSVVTFYELHGGIIRGLTFYAY